MHLSLRNAVVGDAPLLEHWDQQPHVQAAIGSPGFYDDWQAEIRRAPDWRDILIAELDKRPVGILHIIDPAREEAHYWGDVAPNLRAIDIWIGDAADHGCGYGTVMMTLAHQHCFSAPDVQAVIIDPLAGNTDAHRFYERLGYRFVEQRTFEKDLCSIYRLEKEHFTLTP